MQEKGLLLLAKNDLSISKLILSSLNDELALNTSAYHLSQCLEKTIKYCINVEGKQYPQTHEIGILLEILEELGVNYPKILDDVEILLTMWAVKTRYNSSYRVSRGRLLELIEVAEQWITTL